MKLSINLLLNIVLFCVIIILVIIVLNTCNRETTSITERTVTTVRIDTLIIQKTDSFPVPYKVVELSTDTMLYIDTGRVIQDYFTEKSYFFIYEDSAIHATGDIKVLKNAIELAKFDYEVFRPTIYTTTTITEKTVSRYSFALGGGVNYNWKDNRAGLELNAGMRIKRQTILVGHDFINQTTRVGWLYNF